MAEFQDQAAGNLVLRLTRLRQRTATGRPVGPASLTTDRLTACSSAPDVNTGGAETISYLQNQKTFRSTLRQKPPCRKESGRLFASLLVIPPFSFQMPNHRRERR